MRNMSFMLTTQQMRDRTKTVTRRLGWSKIKPGDRLNACVKCQGLGKGGKIEKICEIEVVSNRREILRSISMGDCVREGFVEMDPEQFVGMFCDHMKCGPNDYVNRIEFKYIEGAK